MNMNTLAPQLAAGAMLIALAACSASPQTSVDYEAFVAPSGIRRTTFGDWTVTLSQAQLAFGPVYFCAAASGSSTLCESAIAEIARVTRVDALSSTATPLGNVHGFTGPIQSASYDFGISWFDTSVRATPSQEAPGGHSVHLEGAARRGAQAFSFVADVDLVPQYQGQHAVPTSSAMANVTSNTLRLDVRMDPIAWLKQLDFDAIAKTGQPVVVISPGTPEHSAILVGIKNLYPPEFRWVAQPTQP